MHCKKFIYKNKKRINMLCSKFRSFKIKKKKNKKVLKNIIANKKI